MPSAHAGLDHSNVSRPVRPISGGADPAPEVLPSRYFDVTRVEMGDGLWDGIQRLRYDVYCLECQYLDASRYPAGRESDGFDPHSIHFASTNERQEIVATLRLVRDSPMGFPLEQHGPRLSDEFRALPRDTSAEISRLILAKSYRRRANDGLYGLELGDAQATAEAQAQIQHRRSKYPLILFGLFKVMYMESLSLGLDYWLAAMEPGLQNMLNKFGLGLRQIGDPMEYYGKVIPYYSSIADLTKFIMESRPDVFQFFGDSQG